MQEALKETHGTRALCRSPLLWPCVAYAVLALPSLWPPSDVPHAGVILAQLQHCAMFGGQGV